MSLVPIQYEQPGELQVRHQPGAMTYEPRNLPELIEWARTVCNSDIVPKEMRGKAENVILAVQHGKEIGLTCAQSLQSIYVVNGRPSIYGDAMLGIVKASGLLAEFREAIDLDEDGKVRAAICYARRKGEEEHEPYVFTWQDAITAGLPGRNPLYNQYPKRMLKFKARAYELRDNFPDLLKGIRMVEEMLDVQDQDVENDAAKRIAAARERMRKPTAQTNQAQPKPATPSNELSTEEATYAKARTAAVNRLKTLCEAKKLPCSSGAELLAIVKDNVKDCAATTYKELTVAEINDAIAALDPFTDDQPSLLVSEETPGAFAH